MLSSTGGVTASAAAAAASVKVVNVVMERLGSSCISKRVHVWRVLAPRYVQVVLNA